MNSNAPGPHPLLPWVLYVEIKSQRRISIISNHPCSSIHVAWTIITFGNCIRSGSFRFLHRHSRSFPCLNWPSKLSFFLDSQKIVSYIATDVLFLLFTPTQNRALGPTPTQSMYRIGVLCVVACGSFFRGGNNEVDLRVVFSVLQRYYCPGSTPPFVNVLVVFFFPTPWMNWRWQPGSWLSGALPHIFISNTMMIRSSALKWIVMMKMNSVTEIYVVRLLTAILNQALIKALLSFFFLPHMWDKLLQKTLFLCTFWLHWYSFYLHKAVAIRV